MSDPFAAGEEQWLAGLSNLRDVVRQELVTRQLAAHLPTPPGRVLDIGCGQGTQALRLARRGHEVTGLDPSERLLAHLEGDLAGQERAVRERVQDYPGDRGGCGRAVRTGELRRGAVPRRADVHHRP